MKIKMLIHKLWFVQAVFIGMFSVTSSASANDPHFVVGHWIAPMNYTANESALQQNEDDIRAALEEGVDGFAIDAFSGAQAQNTIKSIINAADAIGAKNFKVFLSADMSLGFSSTDIVNTIVQYGNNPHYLQVNDQPLLSTYGGDKLGDSWWQNDVLNPLSKLGYSVTFIPYFDRPNPNGDAPNYENWTALIKSHPSIGGLFNFGIPKATPFYSNTPNLGNRVWSTLEGEESLSNALHDSGKFFLAPYVPYYWAVCHPARQYMESQGGFGMDNFWKSIIQKQVTQGVEIVTWNDYSESSFIQPTNIPSTKTPGIISQPHLGYYELLKYYISWYHTGRAPTITKDAIFFFYRTSPNGAVASNDASACKLGPIPEDQKWGYVEDDIYITTALKVPTVLFVQSGNKTYKSIIQAGLQTTKVPFQAGAQSFQLARNGTTVLTINGANINSNPVVYNFNVYSGYAIANGTNSSTWKPSDKWKNGFVAEWFK